MVRGLDRFRRHFADQADRYVLIGGTAATLAMEQAGLDFRATKDLDIVLHVEALDARFVETFWRFVDQGGYEYRQASSEKPIFYRFHKPSDESFPAMLELFCRKPEGLDLPKAGHLTPIPIDESVASLSAILLDEETYNFVLAGRKEVDGISWVGEDRLIPLKASAWLDLTARQGEGQDIDSKTIRKHVNDVLRLSQLLTPETRITLPKRIDDDLRRFLDLTLQDSSIDLKALDLPGTLAELTVRIGKAYGVNFERP